MTSILNIDPEGKDKDTNKPQTASSPTEAPSTMSKEPRSFPTATSSTGSATGAATATAKSFYDKAKDTAGQAYDAVSEKAVTKMDEQRSTLSDGLSTVANSIRNVGDEISSAQTESGFAGSAAKYTRTAAEKIDGVAAYFENKDVRDMARDLEGFARRNPAIFLGAAFGLGFLAARFFKSSPPKASSSTSSPKRIAGGEFISNPDSKTGKTFGSQPGRSESF